jgi:hypothetical protein
MAEMPDQEFRGLVFKMIHALKEDSKKEMDELIKSAQDLDKKVTSLRNSASIVNWKLRF